jgi:hypothetical protein
MRGKDPEKRLRSSLDLLDAPEPFAHPRADPSRTHLGPISDLACLVPDTADTLR